MKAFTSGNNLYVSNARQTDLNRIRNIDGVWSVFPELNKNNVYKILYTVDPNRLQELIFKLNMPIKKVNR